jgi:hypothetical protein
MRLNCRRRNIREKRGSEKLLRSQRMMRIRRRSQVAQTKK